MPKITIRKAENIKGKNILLRLDFNVPLKFAGAKTEIVDASRIIASLETIRYLARYGAKIAIATHLGDDPTARHKPLKKYSTAVLARKLGRLLGQKIEFARDCIGEPAEKAFAALPPKGILMLENLRYHPGEKANDAEFAGALSRVVGAGGQTGQAEIAIFVNDAFAVCHRDHASVSAIKGFLPSYCGLIVEREVENLNRVLRPEKPAVAVMGGAKISTKIKLIEKIAASYEKILIGGAMANNFLKAKGFEIGRSLASEEDIALAAKLDSPALVLPIDLIVLDGADGNSPELRKLGDIRAGDIIYDIGPATIKLFADQIRSAKTIVWNGPLGKFEDPHFKHGTLAIARMIARRASGKAFAVAGGGETVEALNLVREMGNIDWVSTGGGAMLAYLGGERMPGLEGII